LQLNETDDDAFRRFVEAAKSAHIPAPSINRIRPAVVKSRRQQIGFSRKAKDHFSGGRPAPPQAWPSFHAASPKTMRQQGSSPGAPTKLFK
jgi:hypothetical protein